jgi:hypothetical protein
MNREQIYEQLNEQIPYLKRHDCTRRVMEATDVLLDQLVEIQHAEGIELLLDEQEVGFGL